MGFPALLSFMHSSLCSPVLLQEIILDELGNLQRDLVTLSEGALAHKLHNLRRAPAKFLSKRSEGQTQR